MSYETIVYVCYSDKEENMTNLRILLVEDDPNWQKILEGKTHIALDSIGHPEDIIKVIKTFAEAYNFLQENYWHLLITDIGLKDSSISQHQKLGIQLVELAKKQKIPVIVVSGTPVVNTQDVRNLIKDLDVLDYFKKGAFDNKTFITTVQEVLQKQLQSSSNIKELLNSSTDKESIRKDYPATATPSILSNSPLKLSTQQQKILILAAIPRGLRLDKEIREIESAIQRSTRQNLFEIIIRTAVRPQDIRRAIAEQRPQIVHFCGHGMEDGSLMLEDDGGNHHPVLPTRLAALFKLHSDYVKCVLLNACYSSLSAEAIGKHINYVIGMNQPIEDRAAIIFAQGFYDGLCYENLDSQDVLHRAFNEGLVALELENCSVAQILCFYPPDDQILNHTLTKS